MSRLYNVSLPVSYAHECRSYLIQGLRKLGAEQFMRGCANGLALGITKHHLCSAAPKEDLSLHIDYKDRILREFKQCSLFPGLNLLLPPLGNVTKDQHNTNDFSLAGENWRGTMLD